MESKRATSVFKRIDQYLLKNNPVSWSTRIHSAVMFGLGFALLLAVISFIAPNDPRNRSIVHYWITLISILSLLAFIFWMIYLLRFNVFKRFGTWKATDTVKTFLFYFIIITIILSWPFIPPVIESVRANAAYSSRELIEDINAMNIKICQLEQDSISKKFQKDTFQVDNSVKVMEARRPSYNDNNDSPDSDHYYLVDTTQLRQKIEDADSVKMLTDSIYVIYTCPNYQFVYDYMSWNFDDEENEERLQLMSSMDLYRQILQNKQVVDKEKVRSELGQLFAKYSSYHHPGKLSADRETHKYSGESYYLTRIRDLYDLDLVNGQIDHITDKKFRWEGGAIQISWRIVYYFSLCLAMLVLIYRHTTRRTFFLSLLAAGVLTILTGIFIAMAPYNDDSFFLWTICYFILFMILSVLIFNSRYRNVVSGIALNLLVFMTPFMPLIITSYYYDSLRERYSHYLYKEYEHLFKNEGLHMFLSEIGGGVLLLLLLATVYQMAYKKWFALPEQ
jgi:MFS family permease